MKCGLRHEKALWRQGIQLVAGVDEAGRGPLAGPVVAAAVVLPERFRHKRLNDSKKLSHEMREEIYGELTARADVCWSVAVVEQDEIDRFNILRATHLGMRRAALALALVPGHVLIDGLPVRPFPFASTALVSGDARSFSIAAASVIAKVTRDRLMAKLDADYPHYGFARHKGYPTPAHLAALRVHGPCAIHRRSFLPVRQAELAFA